jgi:DNA primase
MLPHVAGRPSVWSGCFFQRHGGESISTSNGDSRAYTAIDNLEGLISLVQMGVLEIYVRLSRR